MDKIKIYIEGGGNRHLNGDLRRTFSKLLQEYGVNGNRYQIVAGGSRGETIKAIHKQSNSIILIDSEEIIDTKTKLEHLEKTESKESLKGITENNLFFMVVCMETWMVSDVEALKKYYGSNFKEAKIQNSDLIHKDKTTIMKMIKDSIRECQNNEYRKSESFKILEKVCIKKIVESNSYAKEFFEYCK